MAKSKCEEALLEVLVEGRFLAAALLFLAVVPALESLVVAELLQFLTSFSMLVFGDNLLNVFITLLFLRNRLTWAHNL